MEKIVYWKATAMVGLMALPIAGRAQSADVAFEETLREVTVNSRSAQKRVDEVQIGVENGTQLLCLQLEKLPLSAEHALEMVSFC